MGHHMKKTSVKAQQNKTRPLFVALCLEFFETPPMIQRPFFVAEAAFCGRKITK